MCLSLHSVEPFLAQRERNVPNVCVCMRCCFVCVCVCLHCFFRGHATHKQFWGIVTQYNKGWPAFICDSVGCVSYEILGPVLFKDRIALNWCCTIWYSVMVHCKISVYSLKTCSFVPFFSQTVELTDFKSISLEWLVPPRKSCFHPCPCVCWFVRQDDPKTTERISTKLGWRMSLSPEQTMLTFGVDPDKRNASSLS